MTDFSNPANLIGFERSNLVRELQVASPSDATLCEGWECRHMLAHLLLRESSFAYAAGVMGGPLGERTERLTQERGAVLADRAEYDRAITEFANLPGHFGMRRRLPKADAAMNVIEYFVHIEDIRRAHDSWEPRELPREVQEFMWGMLRGRAKMMVGRRFAGGLVLEAPGYSPAAVTVIAPKPGEVATVLSGEPGELVLYLFGREQEKVAMS